MENDDSFFYITKTIDVFSKRKIIFKSCKYHTLFLLSNMIKLHGILALFAQVDCKGQQCLHVFSH